MNIPNRPAGRAKSALARAAIGRRLSPSSDQRDRSYASRAVTFIHTSVGFLFLSRLALRWQFSCGYIIYKTTGGPEAGLRIRVTESAGGQAGHVFRRARQKSRPVPVARGQGDKAAGLLRRVYLSASVKKGQAAAIRERAPPPGGQLTDDVTTQRTTNRRDPRPAACTEHDRISQRYEWPPSCRECSRQRGNSGP